MADSFTPNWANQLADYRGVLTFPSPNGVLPQVTIPLFIKDHPVPARNPKVSEVITEPSPLTTWGTSTAAVFYGTMDPLVLDLSGWLITPTSVVGSMTLWDPTHNGEKVSRGGTSLGLQNWSYGDVITAYLEGSILATSAGYWDPVHPLSYTDPYGRQYNSPIVTAFNYNYARPHKKQTFTLSLWLEQNDY